jgi:hypothetical protein
MDVVYCDLQFYLRMRCDGMKTTDHMTFTDFDGRRYGNMLSNTTVPLLPRPSLSFLTSSEHLA